jgi:hypothetical protein
MEKLGDVILIISWMCVIAFELPYNGWLIAISIMFWFFGNYQEFTDKEK